MARVPLLQGAYQSRSLIADAQRCVNLYPEANPGAKEGSEPSPTTHYPTPGLIAFSQATGTPARGLYTASDSRLYGVIGNVFFLVQPNGQIVSLGTLNTHVGPVSMTDDTQEVVIVDGSNTGWQYNMLTGVYGMIVDHTSTFQGAVACAYLDTFTLFCKPDGTGFLSTHSGVPLVFDPLYYAKKTGGNDLMVTLAVVHRELWLLGQATTEVWQDVGGALFPFAATPGVFVQHGCAAPFSVCTTDVAIFWLGTDPQGNGIAFVGEGYKCKRISTHAIEHAWQGYPTISDAVAYTYQEGGHSFWVISFPGADKTWVYDMATGQWHERAWLGPDGTLHRHRGVCHAFAYGKHIVGDWQTGQLYVMDPDYTTDNGGNILRLRSFPHMLADGKRVQYHSFMADMECGTVTEPNWSPQVNLRWSDSRGYTWGTPVLQSMGTTGQYNKWPTWRRLGMARDRVFELSWTGATKTALNGAFIDATPCVS